MSGRLELSLHIAEEELGCWMLGRAFGVENECLLDELRLAVSEGRTGCSEVARLIEDSLILWGTKTMSEGDGLEET